MFLSLSIAKLKFFQKYFHYHKHKHLQIHYHNHFHIHKHLHYHLHLHLQKQTHFIFIKATTLHAQSNLIILRCDPVTQVQISFQT